MPIHEDGYFKQLKRQVSYEWGRLDPLEKLFIGGFMAPAMVASACLLMVVVIAILSVFGV